MQRVYTFYYDISLHRGTKNINLSYLLKYTVRPSKSFSVRDSSPIHTRIYESKKNKINRKILFTDSLIIHQNTVKNCEDDDII